MEAEEQKEGSGFFEPEEVGSMPSSQQQGPGHDHSPCTGETESHGSSRPHKRKVGEGAPLEDERREQRHGGSQKDKARLGESRFLGLPDSLHRIVMSFLDNSAICRVVGSSRSLGPLYLSGIRRLDTPSSLIMSALPASKDPQPSDESLARLLGRLTCLEGIRALGGRAVKALASAAVAASSTEGAAWMETVDDAEVNPFPALPCVEAEGAVSEDTKGGHEGLLTLLGLLGRGMWPRLQRLRFSGTKASFENHLKALAGALEGRGGECERLKSLDFTRKFLVAGPDVSPAVQLKDETMLRRLLSSPCCSALEALNFGPAVSLSTACFAQVIAYLRSPSGRRFEMLTCRWIPLAEAVPDPAMLVNTLADGCLPRLRKLEMSCLLPVGPVGPDAASALERWAEGPHSQQLEVFKCRTWGRLFRPLMEGARAGHGFPALKSVYLVMALFNGETVEELCRSMEAGAMPCLETLLLQDMDAGTLARLMTALSRDGTRCSASMRRLAVLNSHADDEEGESVGRALAAGACPGLTELDFNNASAIGDRTARSIADALRGGAAKQLKSLKLRHTALGDEGCLALRAVMRECSTSLACVDFAHSKVTGALGRFGALMVIDRPSAAGATRTVFDGEVLEERRPRPSQEKLAKHETATDDSVGESKE